MSIYETSRKMTDKEYVAFELGRMKGQQDQKQEWISVKDRLPEDDLPEGSKTKRIKVLVAIKTDNGQWVIRSQTRIKIGFHYWQENEWNWGKHSYGEFTHWMPLPEPPRTECDV